MFEIKHIANAGVLIKNNRLSVLIDGIHSEPQFNYKCVQEDIFMDMLMCRNNYDPIDVLLFTHSHADHFDLEWTMAYMYCHKKNFIGWVRRCCILIIHL